MPAQFSGCTGIFLVGEVPTPLKDPYLAIRDCAFVPNALLVRCRSFLAILFEFVQNFLLMFGCFHCVSIISC